MVCSIAVNNFAPDLLQIDFNGRPINNSKFGRACFWLDMDVFQKKKLRTLKVQSDIGPAHFQEDDLFPPFWNCSELAI